jgi:hypothetical protein
LAKLPKAGSGYQLLDEREVTLAEVIASLGLKPLSKKREREIRDRLGFALATWDTPYAVQIKDVVGSLKAHAKRLEQIAKLGTITRSGIANELDVAIGGQLIQTLASDPSIGDVQAAHDYLRSFCDGASTLASSCRIAAATLEPVSGGRPGKPPQWWHDKFTAVLVDICKQYKIEPRVGLDRISGEPAGPLAKVAFAFDRLMPPGMRSRNPATLVKRLQRSLSRLNHERFVLDSAAGKKPTKKG